MTKTLKELLAERTRLEAEITGARKKAAEDALHKVRELVNEFGFTAQQVFPWKPVPVKVAAKYLDEKSGATWTGRGKPPAWIVGKNREDFLIEQTKPQEGPFLAEMAATSARQKELAQG